MNSAETDGGMEETPSVTWFAGRVPLSQTVQQEVINRSVQTTFTDHPSTDRHVTIRTYFRRGHAVYLVAVVNGFNAYTDPSPREYTDPEQARTAANLLLDRERRSQDG